MEVLQTRPTVTLNKIMYATDFSSTAEEAGKYVEALAQRFNSTVDIAHALYPAEDETPLPEELRRDHEERLLLKLTQFRDAGIKTCFAQSTDGPLSEALLLMEKQFQPDLIVTGTTSKSTLDRLTHGSTAEHLIREAPCPVLTVGPNAKPPNDGPLLFEKIVFATDFSKTTDRAAELALAFAENAGAHLWITHVTSTRREDLTLPDGLGEREFRRKLQELIPQAVYDWCLPTYTVEHGSPAQGILDLANRVHADLIVMGARDPSFWLMHLHRGVTQDVLAQAPCPVLTAR
jgi:nucleotide-binding universal stress UspA family protein